MPKQIIIAEQHRLAAVFEEDQIQELVVATGSHQVGDIYLGSVENVLPGIDAAFVNIGDAQRNGFIHVTDLGPLRLKRGSGTITELLMPQQKVLVQVMKEPTGSKGPRLTGNITLPGRYLVLMPYGRGVNLSRRISGSNERSRLRALAILVKPAGMGLLVRTEAEEMAEEAIMEDLEELLNRWESILAEANSASPPALLGRDDDFIVRVLRDMYTSDVNRIVVDSHTGLKRVKQQVINWNGGKTPPGILIDHHRERTSILEYFRVSAAIREALKPRVDLPSGGYVIIEPTEALTVVDVNSGSFTSSATARETVLWTNCEAATEIARQLRLRNIAGVIIVDFIDMDSRKDQLRVLQHFEESLLADKARPQVAQLSELGLVELTRKRQGQNIYELFGHTCKTCNGLGHLAALPGELEEPPTVLMDRSYPAVLRDSGGSSTPQLRINVDSSERDSGDSSPVRVQRNQSAGSTPMVLRSQLSSDRDRSSDYGDHSETEDDRITGLPSRSPIKSSEPIYADNKPAIADDSLSRRTRRRRIDAKDDGEELETPSNYLEEDPLPSSSESKNGPNLQTRDLSSHPSRKEYWDNRPTVANRKRLSPKGVETSPEVVTVEMTPEEQDIYALMGISPLVLLNTEDSVETESGSPWEGRRQSKSTIIRVRSSADRDLDGDRQIQYGIRELENGDGSTAHSALATDEEESLSAPVGSVTSEIVPSPESEETVEASSVPTLRNSEINESSDADRGPSLISSESREEDPNSTDDEEEEEALIRRRRRRRSSAVEE